MSTRGGLRNEELLTFIMQFYRRLALQYLIYWLTEISTKLWIV